MVVALPTTRLALVGARVIVATGARATATGVVVLCPSLVVVIVVLPALTPVTRPVEETVATDGALDVQVSTRPVNTFPLPSFVTAVSIAVPPTSKFALVGVTVIDATGTFDTVMVAVPFLPSLVAVIVALPTPTAVTSPVVASTVATDAELVDQVTMRPVSKLLLASFATADIAWVAPIWRLALVGEIVTVATGINDTVIEAVADFPSLIAVIVAAPADTAVTAPLAVTVATPGVFDDHAIARLLSTLPLASVRTAAMVVAPPTTILAVVGVRVIVATGASDTPTADVALCPSLVAVIVVLPGPTAVTTPVEDTVATVGWLDVQVTVRPVNTFPLPSFVTGVIVIVGPPTSRLALVGVTVMDATGTFDTVTVAVPLFPSLLAVIVAVPTATAVTTPLLDTVAMAVGLDAHVTIRPDNSVPFTSRTVAESVLVPPITMVALVGLTTTDPTGVGVADVTTT